MRLVVLEGVLGSGWIAEGTEMELGDASTTTQQQTKAEDTSRHMCI